MDIAERVRIILEMRDLAELIVQAEKEYNSNPVKHCRKHIKLDGKHFMNLSSDGMAWHVCKMEPGNLEVCYKIVPVNGRGVGAIEQILGWQFWKPL